MLIELAEILEQIGEMVEESQSQISIYFDTNTIYKNVIIELRSYVHHQQYTSRIQLSVAEIRKFRTDGCHIIRDFCSQHVYNVKFKRSLDEEN